jgi:negative regulator of flagellin synthesis FlgM
MKIDGNGLPESKDIGPITHKVIKTEGQDRASGVERTKPADRVEISIKGKEIAEFMAAINQIPEVRIDRVNEIKEAIESGNYRIDPSGIAEKMLKEL